MRIKKEELESLLANIEEVTHLYYQQKNEEANEKLNGLLVQIEQNIEYILCTPDVEGSLIDRDLLNQILDAAMTALMDQDTILLADILNYEVAGRLHMIQPE